MSTKHESPILESALANIQKNFRTRIITTYLEIKKRYSEAHFDTSYDTSGLSAGKFCETLLRFLQHELTGNYIPFGKHLNNFPDEARKLITLPESTGHETLRIILPRALVFIYTLRGKRGIGHAWGDIDANQIDAATIVRIADWIICELIRIYNNLPIEQSQAIIDILSKRNMPDIWEVAGKKRILKPGLDYKQKVLLLCYSEKDEGIMVEDLFAWTEYSSLSKFKKRVIRALHQDRFIEYDTESEIVYISPKGELEVESKILSRPIQQ